MNKGVVIILPEHSLHKIFHTSKTFSQVSRSLMRKNNQAYEHFSESGHLTIILGVVRFVRIALYCAGIIFSVLKRLIRK